MDHGRQGVERDLVDRLPHELPHVMEAVQHRHDRHAGGVRVDAGIRRAQPDLAFQGVRHQGQRLAEDARGGTGSIVARSVQARKSGA